MVLPNSLKAVSCSASDGPDVICSDLPAFHFEVKAVERLNINEAMAQAVDLGHQRDHQGKGNRAGEKIPVVAHKRNRGDWLVTMRASDWFKLLARAPAGAAR